MTLDLGQPGKNLIFGEPEQQTHPAACGGVGFCLPLSDLRSRRRLSRPPWISDGRGWVRPRGPAL